MAGGEGARALAEEGDAKVAGPTGLRGSIREAPAETTRGLREPAVTGGKELRRRLCSPVAAFGRKFGPRNGLRSRVKGAGAPGWWGDADAQALTAVARWSGVPTVAQRRCGGGATRREVLGFGSTTKVGMGTQGGLGVVR
jgi:hypothetical protein